MGISFSIFETISPNAAAPKTATTRVILIDAIRQFKAEGRSQESGDRGVESGELPEGARGGHKFSSQPGVAGVPPAFFIVTSLAGAPLPTSDKQSGELPGISSRSCTRIIVSHKSSFRYTA